MQLWAVVKSIGVAQFVDLLNPVPNTYTTEFQLLGLSCNLSAHLITYVAVDDTNTCQKLQILPFL